MKNILKRFENKYEVVTESGCWIWTAAVWMNGRYGAFWVDDIFNNGRMTSAHRAAIYLYKGIKANTNESVCHRCDNTLCVNPDHLFLGSRADNMKDMVNKGRHKSGREKLSESDKEKAQQMRKEGYEVKKIAEIFNIDRGYASKLVKGCQPKSTRKAKQAP